MVLFWICQFSDAYLTSKGLCQLSIYMNLKYRAYKNKRYKFLSIVGMFSKGYIINYDSHYYRVEITCKFYIGVLLSQTKHGKDILINLSREFESESPNIYS